MNKVQGKLTTRRVPADLKTGNWAKKTTEPIVLSQETLAYFAGSLERSKERYRWFLERTDPELLRSLDSREGIE